MIWQLPKIIIGTLLVFIPCTSFSQNIISGNVYDSLCVPVNNVTITCEKINSTVILAFSESNENGYFQIPINSTDDSLVLNLRHIGYKDISVIIKNKTNDYKFILIPKIWTLEDIVVQSPPIYKTNDTLNYNVNSFTSKEDKVIGDVIKKLPGVEVENGKILYQGNPIQEYLINGLNLLDSKYQLANNNLPADVVRKVQIIENHQPIKILDSLVFSNRASLNLQLKKFTTTGIGKISLGYAPQLWDINLTPMIFNKSFQTLNSFQSNNIGNDVSSELFNSSVTTNSLFARNEDMSLPQIDFLAVQNVTPPPFTKRRWLNNNINMVSSNIIRSLNGGLELKGNVSFYNDFTKETGKTITNFFVPGGNVIISELVNNGRNINDLRGGFSITKNEKKVYFKNNFKFGRQWKNDNGDITKNDSNYISQDKEIRSLNFSNDFSTITILGSQLLNINSILNYFEDPQQLSIVPGQFDSILNNNKPYEKVIQNIFYRNFDFDNSISMVSGINKISIIPRVGFHFGSQNMQSGISAVVNEVQKPLGEDFNNNLKYSTSNLYFILLTQYRSRRLRMELTLPFRRRDFYITNLASWNKKLALHRNTFEPILFLNYYFSSLWEASFSSTYNNRFGGITQLYDAYVLNTYNNLERFNANVPESHIWENHFAFNYKNVLKSVFADIILNNTRLSNNYLFEHLVSSKGLSTLNLITQKNDQIIRSINGDINKYLGNLKTTFKFKSGINFNRSEQVVNDKLNPIKQRSYNVGININNSTLDFLNITYSGNITFIRSWIGSRKLNDIITRKNSLNIGTFPFKDELLSINIDYYLNNSESQGNQVFVDLQYQFSIPRTKINLEITCNNLFNNNMFSTLYNSPYTIMQTSYELRPRQFLIGTSFKF